MLARTLIIAATLTLAACSEDPEAALTYPPEGGFQFRSETNTVSSVATRNLAANFNVYEEGMCILVHEVPEELPNLYYIYASYQGLPRMLGPYTEYMTANREFNRVCPAKQ